MRTDYGNGLNGWERMRTDYGNGLNGWERMERMGTDENGWERIMANAERMGAVNPTSDPQEPFP